MVYEVVCTKSYLDIGLLVEKNPKRVLGRASTFGSKTEYGVGEYGGVEFVKWVNAGVYLTIDKWIRISYNKSTNEILDTLGIKKRFCSPKDVIKSGYKAYMIGLWNRRKEFK